MELKQFLCLSRLMMKLAAVAGTGREQLQHAELSAPDDVVEIGILLPANRAADLIRIARLRQESVGYMLRKLIDRELTSIPRSD